MLTAAEVDLSTATPRPGLTSDNVLLRLAPALIGLGYEVEQGKKAGGKVRRPVLFGESGRATVMYEVDAAHDGLGVVVEVEAGRGAMGNAAYRDSVRTSLILDARFLVLLLPLTYRYSTGAVAAYRDTRDLLQAVYASQRLALPFEGVLLLGY